nr:hypothetical transcript [Hymenolepis microstoma]
MVQFRLLRTLRRDVGPNSKIGSANIEETCRWLTIAGSSRWDNLTQLLDYVNQGESILNRLKEATTIRNVYSPVKITRSKRSHADVGGDTSIAELDATSSSAAASAVTPSIVTACEPFVHQLTLNFSHKLKSLQELASNGRSALLELLEAFQTYSNTETSTLFTSSKVKEAMEIFECMGITRFAESPSSLIAQLESTGLNECLEKCLCESRDEHCNHLAASHDPQNLDVNTQVAQLIFWWCEQVIRWYSKETEQLEVLGHWLTHVSDMLAVLRFLFDGPDSRDEEDQEGGGIESGGKSFHAQIVKCRFDLTIYALKLKEFNKQVGILIEIDEDGLPFTTFEKLIEATVRCPVPFESVQEFWELISKNELDKFTILLKSHYDRHKSTIRETLKDANPKVICKRCRECLDLHKSKVKNPASCVLCPLRPTFISDGAFTVAELREIKVAGPSDDHDRITQSLLQAFSTCISFIITSYTDWLSEVKKLVEENAIKIMDFFSRQPIEFYRKLPEELKFVMSGDMDTKASIAKSSSSNPVSALILLVEGIALSFTIAIPSELQIMRKLVLAS